MKEGQQGDMKLEIKVLAWDRHNNVVGFKPVNGTPTLPAFMVKNILP
jgi:hypothetical protein